VTTRRPAWESPDALTARLLYTTARGRRRNSGPMFFRALMVKGAFCALTGRAAFLFRGKYKAPFHAYTPAGASPCYRELSPSRAGAPAAGQRWTPPAGRTPARPDRQEGCRVTGSC
jgi:hypothetical protein